MTRVRTRRRRWSTAGTESWLRSRRSWAGERERNPSRAWFISEHRTKYSSAWEEEEKKRRWQYRKGFFLLLFSSSSSSPPCFTRHISIWMCMLFSLPAFFLRSNSSVARRTLPFACSRCRHVSPAVWFVTCTYAFTCRPYRLMSSSLPVITHFLPMWSRWACSASWQLLPASHASNPVCLLSGHIFTSHMREQQVSHEILPCDRELNFRLIFLKN